MRLIIITYEVHVQVGRVIDARRGNVLVTFTQMIVPKPRRFWMFLPHFKREMVLEVCHRAVMHELCYCTAGEFFRNIVSR